ncbi:MAG: SMP-30/gluconolactonase/LRE family protein [Thermoleophilia bacterium]
MSGRKGKIVTLVVLIIILALVAVLLTRRSNDRVITGGSSFSFITSIYGFTTPLGVGVDDQDNLWVSNTSMQEVRRYNQDAIELGKIDTKDQKGDALIFNSPYGIDVDDERGRVYVCDYNWRGVRVFTKDGDFLYNLPRDPGDLQLEMPWSPFGVATYGDRVYVTSQDGVYVFDADEGGYIDRWGTKGSEAGKYDFPNGIAADSNNGNIYVADSLNRRVVALTPEGKVRWMLGVFSEGNASVFQLPRGIAVGPDGRIFISDTHSHKIVVVDPDGKLLSIFGQRGTADAQLSFPEGIAISPSYRMYLADRQNDRVQIWQLSEDVPKPNRDDVINFEKALTVVGS